MLKFKMSHSFKLYFKFDCCIIIINLIIIRNMKARNPTHKYSSSDKGKGIVFVFILDMHGLDSKSRVLNVLWFPNGITEPDDWSSKHKVKFSEMRKLDFAIIETQTFESI